MKKIFYTGLFFTLFANAPAIHSKATITSTPPIETTNEIPPDVLSRFYDSFLIDSQGNFLGAMVGEIRNYATMPEILTLVSNRGFAVDGDKVIDRHKPRLFSKGCKYNENWICQFDDSIVD